MNVARRIRRVTVGRRLIGLGVLGAGLLFAMDAFADEATAQVLFNDGRRLLTEGKLDEACEKLAESQRLDPSSGTLLNLALCHEQQGKLATAWGEYISAVRLARAQSRYERARAAEEKAAELEPRLPRITIRVSRRVPGIELARNQERVGPGAIGTALPVDPGRHVISASAPGYLSWETTVDTAEAERKEVDVPELQLDPEASKPPIDTAPSPAPAPRWKPAAPAPMPADRPPSETSGASITGWLIAGAGAATLGVGAFFGVQSLRAYDRAEAACPDRTACPDSALSDRDAAERDAWIANVAIPVGLVGIAVGGYLVLSSASEATDPEMAVGVVPAKNGALLGWAGTF